MRYKILLIVLIDILALVVGVSVTDQPLYPMVVSNEEFNKIKLTEFLNNFFLGVFVFCMSVLFGSILKIKSIFLILIPFVVGFLYYFSLFDSFGNDLFYFNGFIDFCFGAIIVCIVFLCIRKLKEKGK